MVLATECCLGQREESADDNALYLYLKKFARQLREQVLPRSKLDPIMVRLVIEEFCRNVLHGENSVITCVSLADGSWLLIGEDCEGRDHLDPRFCSSSRHGLSIGTDFIISIVGAENYFVRQDADGVWRSYLRIP